MIDTKEHYEIATPNPDAAFSAISSGTLEVRLAQNVEEIDASQALRYKVFYEERAAKPIGDMGALKRDFDAFDSIADHLLVLDYDKGSGCKAVVGTYRLLRRSLLPSNREFYTAGEYDISKILAYPGQIMELGRSCVDLDHRNRPTMQLLWRGIAAYVFKHNITLMFGCASLPGIKPDAVGTDLSYLYHYHLAPDLLRVRALDHLNLNMNRVPIDLIDAKRALATLPPLIKGYLRLGGFVGEGAVIDRQFNTIDVCVIVQTSSVTNKYYKHYERESRSV
ncbi:ornithine-acyl[acyl carrier protein] N-acyltransferase [Candidatus Endolissoclinum faulkneri L5]|uniref:L-ornithine N(alpha)-acyltransferase n=1 Tax=Candidatus Endolissoclinum faulkneri L5 TaxID=1401328 RepID=V9TUN8_9PROT|nr:GNAT family N-acyltransferase [Candidatus Endolissoclinum faulkneri]AHC73403.1 ornithine-acyl[acyl carrier protein] N-acyltransferase [Candidatus Endolissoclinum faulkneri L5]